MGTQLKDVTELPADTIKNLISTLTKKKSEIEEKMQTIETENPNYGDYVTFDIDIKETFLEVEQTEENKKFYELEDPSPQSLLVAKMLAVLLGRSDIIVAGDDKGTWDNIRGCFKEEMGEKISTCASKRRRVFPWTDKRGEFGFVGRQFV
eukprot:TRINITY_DN1953_c0_g1_i20.p1 TRINITY_DN1953_c0_g1~~TRINITY_DN1953_c0_g1_i20.p1  ORF type:complete len:150 (+),score=30.42 TRINITY_DN1953_c0_g1_i20:423-872(+)